MGNFTLFYVRERDICKERQSRNCYLLTILRIKNSSINRLNRGKNKQIRKLSITLFTSITYSPQGYCFLKNTECAHKMSRP